MRKAYVPLIVMLSLLAAPTLAKEFIHEETGLKFNLPRGWATAQDGDALIATNPDETIAMIFMVTDVDRSDDLVDAVTSELDGIIRDAQLTNEPIIQQINNLMQIHAEGIGTCSNGETCDWDLTLVTGADRNLFVVALGDIDRYEAAIHRVYNSIMAI